MSNHYDICGACIAIFAVAAVLTYYWMTTVPKEWKERARRMKEVLPP